MLEKLEKDLSIDIRMKNRKDILEIFRLAKSLQLPVVENGKAAGLIALIDLCQEVGEEVDIPGLMQREFVAAGAEEGIFSFANSKQDILPFVDENGSLEGFINRRVLKCYLPNEEYMKVLEEGMQQIFEEAVNGEPEKWKQTKHSFDVIFETNYDGLYITVGKGDTLSVNTEATYIHDPKIRDIVLKDDQIDVSFLAEEKNCQKVNVLQNVQKKMEFSVSENVISDGGIIRVVNNIRSLERIRKELEETQRLAQAYKAELQAMQTAVYNSEEIVGESPQMRTIVELALRVSAVETTTLIQGPSGVGKGVISRFIHEQSGRKDGPFIKIDCGAIPEHLLESELFGYVKGAFTGAEKEGKIGQIELADHGTVFLDEIGELPLNLQTKLLRVIQDRQIMRVGSNELIDVDIRIIAATNRDLKEMVGSGAFREDLFYRLNVVPIQIPPLKGRVADIRMLIDRCLERFNERYQMEKTIDRKALRKLLDYSWPGNVRELENMVEYLMVTTEQNQIQVEDLPQSMVDDDQKGEISLKNITSLKDAVGALETSLLNEAMKVSKSTDEMAKALKVDRSTITRKLQKYGIRPSFDK